MIIDNYFAIIKWLLRLFLLYNISIACINVVADFLYLWLFYNFLWCSMYMCQYRATFFWEIFRKINMLNIKTMNE